MSVGWGLNVITFGSYLIKNLTIVLWMAWIAWNGYAVALMGVEWWFPGTIRVITRQRNPAGSPALVFELSSKVV